MTADYIHKNRNNIIPIIGENCFYYYSENGQKIPLQEFLVDKMAEKGQLCNEDMLRQMKTRGYYGLSLCRQECFKRDSQYIDAYKEIIDNAEDNIHIDEIIKDFLEQYGFNLIITTSCFDFIERDLIALQYSSEPYSAKGSDNPMENKNKGIVYHIFGHNSMGNFWAYDEESLLNILHQLHDTDSSPRWLQDYVFAKTNNNTPNKNLLLLNSNLPDWLFRFFLYPLAYEKNDWQTGNYYMGKIDDKDDSLKNFIKYVVPLRLEDNVNDVLEKATELMRNHSHNEILRKGDEKLERIEHKYKYDIFISYASEDREKAAEIKAYLEKKFKLNIWMDYQGGIPDGEYIARIITGIQNSAYFMPVITSNYISRLTNHSCKRKRQMKTILEDGNAPFFQKEAWAANSHWNVIKEQRGVYSLPLIFNVDYGDLQDKSHDAQELLPENLFYRTHAIDENEYLEKDWSRYKTIEYKQQESF